METGRYLYLYDAVNNEEQKIKTYYNAEDVKSRCDRAIAILPIRKGMGRYYVPAVKATSLTGSGNTADVSKLHVLINGEEYYILKN